MKSNSSFAKSVKGRVAASLGCLVGRLYFERDAGRYRKVTHLGERHGGSIPPSPPF